MVISSSNWESKSKVLVAYLIDFADRQGVTYAMETISTEHLIPLLYNPVSLQEAS